LAVTNIKSAADSWFAADGTKAEWTISKKNDVVVPQINVQLGQYFVPATISTEEGSSKISATSENLLNFYEVAKRRSSAIVSGEGQLLPDGVAGPWKIGETSIPVVTAMLSVPKDQSPKDNSVRLNPSVLGDKVLFNFFDEKIGFIPRTEEEAGLFLWRDILDWKVVVKEGKLILDSAHRLDSPLARFDGAEILSLDGVPVQEIFSKLKSPSESLEAAKVLAVQAARGYALRFAFEGRTYKTDIVPPEK
jgi:hypothetical protein